MLTNSINYSHLGLSPPAPSPPSLPDPPSHFVESFKPACAGINLLLTEWFDQILHLAPPRRQSVSINITTDRNSFHSFPVLLDSAFTSSPTITTPPLIVDTRASCCISPCQEDFFSYSSSTAKIRNLSRVYTVAGKGMLCWRILDHHHCKQIVSKLLVN